MLLSDPGPAQSSRRQRKPGWDKVTIMRRYRSSQAGFTLMELMITTVIVGIVAAMAVPRFQIAFERLEFRSETQEMHSLLQLGRSKAISEKRQYGVHFDDTRRIITLFRDDANPGGFDFVNGDSVIKADTLSPVFTYLMTDFTNNILVFQPNGSCRFQGGGAITTMAQTQDLIGIHQSTILASTGRVSTEAHYY
ncbi:prepilin-type N-terminal cleavage/methylation domain-containing protein [candidate division GN15 bacterium]|nr:prepilin-type N-terminal cleavage/methylation domain-containing protein [candidate division GN15 bacterium]